MENWKQSSQAQNRGCCFVAKWHYAGDSTAGRWEGKYWHRNTLSQYGGIRGSRVRSNLRHIVSTFSSVYLPKSGICRAVIANYEAYMHTNPIKDNKVKSFSVLLECSSSKLSHATSWFRYYRHDFENEAVIAECSNLWSLILKKDLHSLHHLKHRALAPKGIRLGWSSLSTMVRCFPSTRPSEVSWQRATAPHFSIGVYTATASVLDCVSSITQLF